MDISHEQYNVIHYSKHEKVLLETCVLYLYFPAYLVEQYLETYHNNVTHISSEIDHNF